MSTFDEIRKQINKEIEEKQNQNPVSVSSRPTPNVDENGMPDIVKTGPVGTLVSKPGSEKIILDATTFQFMECNSASYANYNKKRFCLVEKNKVATYGNQYINSAGDRVHMLSQESYMLLLGVISGASKQVRTLSHDLARAEELRDTYKSTLDTLRKNGIID